MRQWWDQHDAVMPPTVVEMKNNRTPNACRTADHWLSSSSSSLTERNRTKVESDSFKRALASQSRGAELTRQIRGTWKIMGPRGACSFSPLNERPAELILRLDLSRLWADVWTNSYVDSTRFGDYQVLTPWPRYVFYAGIQNLNIFPSLMWKFFHCFCTNSYVDLFCVRYCVMY